MDQTKKTNIIIGIFFSIIVLIAALMFLPLLNKTFFEKETRFWVGRIAIWLCLALIFLYTTLVEKEQFLLWTEKQLSSLEYFKSFFRIFFLIIIGAIFINLVLKLLGFTEAKNLKLQEIIGLLQQNFPLLLFTCLTAGITEELIFRGYLLPRLQLVLNNNYASIIISSVLFGLMHIGYGTIFQVLGPVLIGLIFAIHYQKFQNIKILIFCHFFWDFLSLLAAIYIKN